MNHFVYKIYSDNSDKIYIGYTKNIKRRFWQHKRNSTKRNQKIYNYPISKFIRDNNNNIKLKLLHTYEKKNEALNKETELIQSIDIEKTLNIKKIK